MLSSTPEDAVTHRRPLQLGIGLKMYFDLPRTREWAEQVRALAQSHPAIAQGTVDLWVLPTTAALESVASILAGSPVAIGAQDLAVSDAGAFTGETSGVTLAQLGCRFVEVGHAERRSLFHEDEDIVRAKMTAAVRNNLIPVLCVGEASEGSPADAAAECVRLLQSAVADLDEPADVIVAYEPVWAIGAAQPASAQHIEVVTAALRKACDADTRLGAASIIYGGSAGRGQFAALPQTVDGLFVGRGAHDVADLRVILDDIAARAGSISETTAQGSAT